MLHFGSTYFPSPEKLLILRQKEWKMRVHQQVLSMLDSVLLVRVPPHEPSRAPLLGAQVDSAVECLVS